jgi:hypothetical protein
MFTPTEQFITQMKFRELRAQREKALTAYDFLEQELANVTNEAERLRILYRGLRNLTFAKQPLHPDVANLEPLLRELDSGEASPETVGFWRAQLEQELARGRICAEIVYIFGALLEERSLDNAQRGRGQEQAEAQVIILSRLSGTAQDADDSKFAQTLFDELKLPQGAAQTAHARKIIEEVVYAPVEAKVASIRRATELENVLERIHNDVYRSSAIRTQAQRFRLNPTLLKELSDALMLMIDHLDEWNWPAGGVAGRTLWAGNKWRLFLDEDLPTACLLELLGARWQEAIEKIWSGPKTDRVRRLQRLQELGAPAIILDNEMALLSGSLPSEDPMQGDIWSDGSEAAARATIGSGQGANPFWGELGSIYAQRATAQGDLRSFDHFDRYGATEAKSGLDQALGLINAEIQLGQAAFPDRPIYVLKLDIKDFYASLQHNLILSLLARLGFAERELTFFRRYLAAPISVDGQRIVTQVGAPVARRLSDLLGELMLLLLDRYVRQRSRVQIVRIVDDICVIAAAPNEAVDAWNATRAFCDGFKLALNDEKCGAVSIGATVPASLPSTLPRWQLLALDGAGNWTVDEEAFQRFLTQTRQEWEAASSVIAKIDVYNAGVRFLQRGLALRISLGTAHRKSVALAVRRFHYSLAASGMDIVQSIREAIRTRFMNNAQARLPEGWVYWPITAGGLGLRQIMLIAASYAESFAQRDLLPAPTERAVDWQLRNNDWARYYDSFLNEVKQTAPAPNKVMETLVSDFISRGAGLSHGKQKTLSVYWRWILYIYGPQILDAFGTFRFLFSELVPLNLILDRSLQGDEGDEAEEVDF